MKKMIVVMLVVAAATMITGCQQVQNLKNEMEMKKAMNTVYEFTGTIAEDYEKSAVVHVDEGYPIGSSGTRVTVSLNVDDELLDVQVGDKVHVEYKGRVMESMPLQLDDQISISVIDSAGDFEDVDDALLEANTLEGVEMTLLDATPTSVKLSILNTTDMEILYGSDYVLQIYEQGDWQDMPYLVENAAFTAEAYTAVKDQPSEWEVNWEVFHGVLDEGTYRILKPVMDFRATGDYKQYYLDVEFTITEE
ncbi:MAG: hypothetical protein IJO55_00775 [Lachnospiraceae bacterium]|nr:hypothetical protein [Lachnospiraceae bacterium]MBQ6856304.1 hypothetical protein [Lachnospiraceae bacterium]